MGKKLVVLIISLFLMLICTISANAAEIMQNDLKLLTDLGVYDDEFSDFDEEITRARFAVLVSRLIGSGDMAEGYMSYADIPTEMEEYRDILNLYNRNFIAHTEAYRPDDVISQIEAIRILASVLGYDDIAQIRGGYPEGYKKVGADLELSKGVNVNNITVGDALKMIVNSLDADIFDYTSRSTKNVPLTELYRNIVYKRATITANRLTSIDSFPAKSLSDKRIEANGELFYDNDNKADKYLGFEVEIWYNHDTMEIVSVIPVNNVEHKRLVPGEILSVNDPYTIAYQDDEKGSVKKVRLDKAEVKVILNGTYTPLYSKSDLAILNGYIEMYDTDNDGDYDIVYVWNPKVYVVDKASKDCLYFKYGEKFRDSTYIEKTEDVNLYLDGQPAEPSDFIEWDIINIYETDDDKVRIESEFKRVSGSLTSVSGEKIVIDNEEYEVNPNGHFDISAYELGKYIDVYLDLTGRVYAGVQVGERGLLTGYITKITYRSRDEETYIEFFDSDGQFKKYVCAEKVKVYSKDNKNGYTIKKQESIESHLLSTTDDGTCYQLVKFSLDDENKINAIYCAIPSSLIREGSDYPLKLEYDAADNTATPGMTEEEIKQDKRKRSAYAGVLYFRYRVNWGVKFFLIPADPEDRNYFQLKYAQNVGISYSGHTFDSIKLYNCDINGEPELALTVSSAIINDTPEGYAPTGVVVKVAKVLYDDEPAYCLSILSEGKIKEAYITNEYEQDWVAETSFYGGMKLSELKPGDLIEFEVDYKNEIKTIRSLVRYNSRGVHRIQDLDSTKMGEILDIPTTVAHLAYGRVVKKYPGPRVMIEVEDKSGNKVNHEYVFIWKENYVAKYYLIKNEGKVSVEQGTLNDIAEGDEIAFKWDYYGIDDVFIYKD